MTIHGSRWFPFGLVAGTDYYPTTGSGGFGSGSLTTESDMRDSVRVSLDALIVTLIDAASTVGADSVWTVKDASGVTIKEFTIADTTPNGHEIRLGMEISGLGGFTVASDDVACVGIALYRTIYKEL